MSPSGVKDVFKNDIIPDLKGIADTANRNGMKLNDYAKSLKRE